jgi:thiol-disulfide isomerase/thioredoxin
MRHIQFPLLLLIAGAPALGAQTPAKGKAPAPAPAKQLSFKEHKLAAIDAWLAANKTPAADRGEALSEAADLALDLARCEKARDYADAYLKDFAKGDKAGAIQLVLGSALGGIPGKQAEARKAFQKAVDDAGEDVNAAIGATTAYSDFELEAGSKEGAAKVWEALGEKHGKVRGIKEFIKSKAAEMEEIDTDPKPIDVKGFDGKPLKLDSYKGKVVLIDFWATWCGPCVQELPNVIATFKKYHAQGFEIIGISLDEDEEKLKSFLAAHEMPWAQFFDGKGWGNEVGQAYGVKGIPKTYLLDREGKIRRVGLRGNALGKAVEKLLAAKSAGTSPKK